MDAKPKVGDVECGTVGFQRVDGCSGAGNCVVVPDGATGIGESYAGLVEIDRSCAYQYRQGRVGDVDHGDTRITAGSQGVDSPIVGDHIKVIDETGQNYGVDRTLGHSNRGGLEYIPHIEGAPGGATIGEFRNGGRGAADLDVGAQEWIHVNRLHSNSHVLGGRDAVCAGYGEAESHICLYGHIECCDIARSRYGAGDRKRYFGPGHLAPLIADRDTGEGCRQADRGCRMFGKR